jgi:hypothetical protein
MHPTRPLRILPETFGYLARTASPSVRSLKGADIMNDFVPRPHEPYDAHWVIKHDLANIIAKYTDRGDHETAAVYIEALARYSDD